MQNPTPEQIDDERADHEAGHYVVLTLLEAAHVLWFITLEHGIIPCKEGIAYSGGCVGVEFFKEQPLTREQAGVYAVAGMMAQLEGIARRHGEQWVEDPRVLDRVCGGGSHDLEQFHDEHGKEADLPSYYKKAGDLLKANWPMVEALGKELKNERTLYHEETFLIFKALKGSAKASDLLEVYREHRRGVDISGQEFEDFRKKHPSLGWYESLRTFIDREGCAEDQDFDDWYAEKMGHPRPVRGPEVDEPETEESDLEDDHPPSQALSLRHVPGLLIGAAVDIAKLKLKARIKKLLPWS